MSSENKKEPLLVITGPTATGKSEVGVLVAEKLGGEIISADSMLIYRGMDIGTAKPTNADRRGIPHHMIDIVEPDQDYNVALYREQAMAVIKKVLERGNLPIVVGGTGLYIEALIRNYSFGGAGTDKTLRKKLQKEAAESPFLLHQRLAKIDPATASQLHPANTRRVIRALEVYYLTGKPISNFKRLDEPDPPFNLLMFGLTMEREALYRRIEKRVDRMIAMGLIEEVQNLLQRGFSPGLNSMRGLGYKEMISYLNGTLSLEEAVEVLKRNTRRFAKRQMTWFRRYKEIRWLKIENFADCEAIAQEIARCTEGVL
ncbi:MAG: tRNA (adenosine(37)-N6)-dimethylallyltransferase MiaA [Syntrophothermus sp.]|uniref:tRNA (adenosine(37)-N6)-dimethylallyltransferase MiaA n=1 Tax=Syntrophothermus sp. TaxID=2736299 RepID=UPI0025802A0B|nr:tRNA (adenosine(37)-N6)-dimethylallyltransferase MiaA [Syntrophothermus sp.]NSW82499.1 tRNA (adenosine(37)-N6)-dimethylallyltransferase MiaA [Syntrophothermus sp.]